MFVFPSTASVAAFNEAVVYQSIKMYIGIAQQLRDPYVELSFLIHLKLWLALSLNVIGKS